MEQNISTIAITVTKLNYIKEKEILIIKAMKYLFPSFSKL
ncbi:17311_t:CDS:2 [Gigaspora margarita]|uniref:17311_t:CDS:1 n=1 Tax=Gigaspora margarita TaxID=4874 RepID=A0ABM8W4D9_GIGMA|nr:17311_t:CDS:2 [Gigaspora margarita]